MWEKNILRQGNLPLAQHTAKQRQAAGASLPFTPIALTHFYDSLAKHRFSIPQEIPALKNSSQAKFSFFFFPLETLKKEEAVVLEDWDQDRAHSQLC